MSINFNVSTSSIDLGSIVSVDCFSDDIDVETFRIKVPFDGGPYANYVFVDDLAFGGNVWDLSTDNAISAMMSLIPSGQSSATVDLDVDSCDANGNVIETIVFHVQVNIPDTNDFKISAVLKVIDTNPKTADIDGGVQGLSTFQCQLTDIQTKYGATISNLEVWMNGQKLREFQGNFSEPFTLAAPVSSGDQQLDLFLIDNHGLKTKLTKVFNVKAYSPPELLSCQAFRTSDGINEDRNATTVRFNEVLWKIKQIKVDATRYNTQAMMEIYLVDNGEEELLDYVSLDPSKNDGDLNQWINYTTAKTLTQSFLKKKDYFFRLKLSDSFSEISRLISVPKSYIPMSWYKNGNGVAFGMKSVNPFQADFGFLVNTCRGLVQRKHYDYKFALRKTSNGRGWINLAQWKTTSYGWKISLTVQSDESVINAYASSGHAVYWIDGVYNNEYEAKVVSVDNSTMQLWVYFPQSAHNDLVEIHSNVKIRLPDPTDSKTDIMDYTAQSYLPAGVSTLSMDDATPDHYGYPIGSLYFSIEPSDSSYTHSENPSYSVGGTWESMSDDFGGRTLVCTGTYFDGSGAGGSRTFRLGDTGGSYYLKFPFGEFDFDTPPGGKWGLPYAEQYERIAAKCGYDYHVGYDDARIMLTTSQSDGGGTIAEHANIPQPNMPPYFTVSIWKRVG